jgi:hypothetical protein
MSDGKLKTPPPIMDPTTRAMSGRSVSLGDSDEALSAVAFSVVIVLIAPS